MIVFEHRIAKNVFIFFILISSFIWAAHIKAEETDSPKNDSILPIEIHGYYDDLNFIVSYSTPVERNMIRKIKDLDDVKHLPDRLKKIGIMLTSLEKRVIGIDKIIHKKPGNRLNQRAFPFPELNEITDIREGGNNVIMVYIYVRPLSSEENALLISDYNKSDKKEIALYKNKKSYKSTHRTEIHRWIKVNNEWKKSYANIVFLDS